MKHAQTATCIATTKILPRNHSFAEKHENIAPRKLPAIRYTGVYHQKEIRVFQYIPTGIKKLKINKHKGVQVCKLHSCKLLLAFEMSQCLEVNVT